MQGAGQENMIDIKTNGRQISFSLVLKSLFTGLCAMGLISTSLTLAACGPDLKSPSQTDSQLTDDSSSHYVQVQSSQATNKANMAPVVGQSVQAVQTAQTAQTAQTQNAEVGQNSGEVSAVNTVLVAPPVMAQKTVSASVAVGQKTENKANATVAVTPETVVAQANQQALQLPLASDFFNATMTYNYMPGAVYSIYCAPLSLTDIALEPGEKIISIAAGDSLRWQISQTYSGSLSGALVQHIIIKPNADNLKNTILITTDRRVYHLVLMSQNSNSDMVEVKWNYPSSPVTYVTNQAQGYSGDSGSVLNSNTSGSPFQLDLSRLDFNYKFGTVKGAKPSWYPTRIFNDGRQTFIEFPADFYNSELPVLYIATTDKTYGTMVNWRLKGRYMVIDAVINKAKLASGVASDQDQTVVQIEHVN